ncbi:MAG: bifunctional phosphopantothenoylcysteine decarboxylase/phosphopantothenate--cysteine ligase CoaBC [Bacteroidales bacterium]
MLKGKHIVLGVTGSIAAYKAAALTRALIKEGAEIKVIMTATAKEFITPLTMATLSKHPILVEFFNPENGDWNSHVSLGVWADLLLIAPASANTMAKMASGIADNLLLTTYLSAKCPVMAAPAMDLDMYKHPATQNNIDKLKEIGVHIIEPGSGELASGLEGKGRMEEPEVIAEKVRQFFAQTQSGDKKAIDDKLAPSGRKSFTGRKVLLTAGPTVEKIDPVRYLSNHSTGTMGYALAQELAAKGAQVKLVSGPVNLTINQAGIELIKVTSADEMYRNSLTVYEEGVDIAIFAAAVADYTPAIKSDSKIKKKGDTLTIELLSTRDIAFELGRIKREGVIHIGFALETEDETENALSKLQKKRFDAVILNSLNHQGAGFGPETNKITILPAEGEKKEYALKSKREVACDIVNYIEDNLLC